MKRKKLLLTIGSATAILAPVAAVVSCGKDDSDGITKYNLLPTYTGQEDQLIALGIKSDYYPLQLNAEKPYGYLLNPEKYMTQQTEDFKKKFADKIKSLMPSVKGTSWWNQDALQGDEQGSDPAYWQKQQGGLLMYEHYLLDDDAKIIDNSNAPKHDPAATVQTNFRASRDPFTRIPKGVFFAWDFTEDELKQFIGQETDENKVVASADIDSDGLIKGELKNDDTGTVKITLGDIKITQKLKALNPDDKGEANWAFNDKYFVDTFHRMFLDNKDFQTSPFKNWIVDSTEANPFGTTKDGQDFVDKVKQLFDASTYRKEEVEVGIGPSSNAHAIAHHPIYEQQEGTIGAAPMFEGAMRDNQLYLFNVAWQLDNIVTFGTPYGQAHYKDLPEKITKDQRDPDLKIAQSKEEANKVKDYLKATLSTTQFTEIGKAFDNAVAITSEMKTRMEAIKNYINEVKQKVNHKDPLTFGVVTIAPGQGESTIQTMSKYSFIYKELGFKQPQPGNLDSLAAGAKTFTDNWQNQKNSMLNDDGEINSTDSAVKNAVGSESLFNMDDNGWFWTLGESGHLSTINMGQFKDSFDLGVITSRDENFAAELEKDKSTNAPAFAEMFKAGQTKTGDDAVNFLKDQRVDYDLWNEGIKTPFVMHMILDQIIGQVDKWAKTQKADFNPESISKRADAINWGNYFTNDFVK